MWGNLYLIILAGLSYLFFDRYVKKSNIFRNINRILLYITPFIYLTLSLYMVVNFNKGLVITQRSLAIVFTPFIIMCALAITEGRQRYVLNKNQYVPDTGEYLKTMKADLKNIPKYKEMLIRQGYDISKWSDQKVFDTAREIEYNKILKIKKKKKKK